MFFECFRVLFFFSRREREKRALARCVCCERDFERAARKSPAFCVCCVSVAFLSTSAYFFPNKVIKNQKNYLHRDVLHYAHI